MAQSLTEALGERAQVAARADRWERDQEAWNLPRSASAAEDVPPGNHELLDWDRFLATYFPGSRRHDLKAIVAYAAYKSSGDVPSAGPGALPNAEGPR
jgi:hypothetical protein